MTLLLVLLMAGFIFTCAGLAMMYYRSLFTKGTVEYEAKVIRLSRSSSSQYAATVTPIVEYSTEGGTVKAHHYIPVAEAALECAVGDVITIEVNPKRPKVFRSSFVSRIYESSWNSSAFMLICGCICFAAGIVVLLVTKLL